MLSILKDTLTIVVLLFLLIRGKLLFSRIIKNEYDEEDNIYKKLSAHLPKLVELYEKIQAELPIKYEEFKREDGKRPLFVGVRGIEGAGDFKTLFTHKQISYEISVEFLFPIFGAFRALLKTKDNELIWEFDPMEVWDKVGTRLVQNTFDTNTNPQQIGKSKTLW